MIQKLKVEKKDYRYKKYPERVFFDDQLIVRQNVAGTVSPESTWTVLSSTSYLGNIANVGISG